MSIDDVDDIPRDRDHQEEEKDLLESLRKEKAGCRPSQREVDLCSSMPGCADLWGNFMGTGAIWLGRRRWEQVAGVITYKRPRHVSGLLAEVWRMKVTNEDSLPYNIYNSCSYSEAGQHAKDRIGREIEDESTA